MIVEGWFNTGERIALLHREALSWRGTPFFANGNAKGRGVSCQKLVAAIYRAIGCCDIEVPDVDMAHGAFADRHSSLVVRFMAKRTDFAVLRPATPGQALPPGTGEFPCLQPGDLLGFTIKRVVHHLGIYLGRSEFVHAVETHGAQILHLADPTWGSRFRAAWRPLGTGVSSENKAEKEIGEIVATPRPPVVKCSRC